MMAADLQLTIIASALTVVSNHAAWHFVWRYESQKSQKEEESGSPILRLTLDYFIPMLPVFVIIMGADRLYDDGFTKVALILLYSLLAITITGSALSSLSWKFRYDEGKESRALVDDNAEFLPEEALKHMNWTISLSAISGVAWGALLYLL